MYTSNGESTSKVNYRHLVNSDPRVIKNTVKIGSENNPEGKIPIELTFTKNNAILIRNIYIHPINVDRIVRKICERGFILDNVPENVSNINTINQEYSESSLSDLNRQAYNNSFQQKYLKNK